MMTRESPCPDREPGFKDRLALWIVRLSKLGRVDRRDTASDRVFYEQFFVEKDRRAYEEDPRMRVRRRVLSSFLKERFSAGATVVDVGCGLGDVLEGIGTRYARVGVEVTRSSLRVAARRLNDSLWVIQGSVLQLPLATARFDVCLCLEVLEHVKDDEAAVRELFRVVRPGGFLVASVPYTYYWDDYLRLIGHHRHYTRRSFRDLLHGVGFEVDKYLPNFPEWHQAFTRRYAIARAVHLVTKPLSGQDTVYDLTWPCTNESVVETIRRRLERRRQREVHKNYEEAATSTFIAARKPG